MYIFRISTYKILKLFTYEIYFESKTKSDLIRVHFGTKNLKSGETAEKKLRKLGLESPNATAAICRFLICENRLPLLHNDWSKRVWYGVAVADR